MDFSFLSFSVVNFLILEKYFFVLCLSFYGIVWVYLGRSYMGPVPLTPLLIGYVLPFRILLSPLPFPDSLRPGFDGIPCGRLWQFFSQSVHPPPSLGWKLSSLSGSLSHPPTPL